MSEPKPVIVLVDDEDDLGEPTAHFLRERGLDVREADGGRTLDRLLDAVAPAIVVLDVSMPEEDGFAIARRLRAARPGLGIVMLTARGDVIDRILALELGADDYVVKPFEPRELLARIDALIRRLGGPAASVAVAAEPAPPDFAITEFWASTAQGHFRIAIDAIDWIEAARDYAILHCGNRNHMVRVTMTELEAGLDPAEMIRIHRSAFVRRTKVAGLSRVGRHTMIQLDDGLAFRVGPQFLGSVRGILAAHKPG